MTRAEMIAEIRDLAVELPKGLSRMRHAELSDLLASMRYEAAHAENERRAGEQEVQVFDAATGVWTTQTVAQMQYSTLPVGTLVTANFAPGVWEVESVDPAEWTLDAEERLLAPVDPDAKAYAAEMVHGRIIRRVSELWTGEPESIRQMALLTSSEMTSDELFDMAWAARDEGAFWAAYVLDNMAEDAGGHGDGRATCYACGTWSNHTHDKITARKIYTWPQIDTDRKTALYHPQTVTV